jgi:hypothetical protein
VVFIDTLALTAPGKISELQLRQRGYRWAQQADGALASPGIAKPSM